MKSRQPHPPRRIGFGADVSTRDHATEDVIPRELEECKVPKIIFGVPEV